MELDVTSIAALLGGSISGDGKLKVSGVRDLAGAGNDDISFILSEKNAAQAAGSKAKVILSDSLDRIEGKTVIKVKSVKPSYAKLLKELLPSEKPAPGISKTASVDASAEAGTGVHVGDFAVISSGVKIGGGSVISAGCFIGKNCIIGKNTIINPNVTVYESGIIGDNCIIHSGTIIGADGFAFAEDGGRLVKIPQVGSVRIGNDVEIGAGCTIDRAAFGETIIEDSVKLDNLVQIAHNCVIGTGTVIAAQTGIAGSVRTGKFCVIGGQVGVADHVTIGNFVKIGSQTGVGKDIPDNQVVSGTPARPLLKLRRAEAYMNKLDGLFKKVKQIEEDLNNKK